MITSLSLSSKRTHTHTRTHLSLYLREGVPQLPKLGMAVRVVAEQPVEEFETVGAGSFHQSKRAGEPLGVDGRPRKPLSGE